MSAGSDPRARRSPSRNLSRRGGARSSSRIRGPRPACMTGDRRTVRAARLAALALAATLAAGSTTPVSAADPWFAVELIAFDDLEGDGIHAEVWPADPGEPPVDDAVELANLSRAAGAFRLTPRSELRLHDTWGALRRSSRYRPLLHVGWRLPGIARDAARWAYLGPRLGGGRDGTLVRGAARVSLARYLHLELDLLYDRPRSESHETPGDAVPTRFRLRSSRRMRSNELHYIDHPLFGVLVVITRVEPQTGHSPALD